MRYLRGPSFAIICILAVGIGLGVGSGWFRRAASNIQQSPATLGLGAPPGPVRMTLDEYDRYRARVREVFGEKVPKHTELLLLGGFDFSGFCERFNGPKRCRVDEMTPFYRALLAESDPTTEVLFLVTDRPEGKPHAETVRTAFIPGKDGRAKIVVETPGDVRELTARVVGGGMKEERRIVFRLLDRSARIHKRDYPPVPKSFAVFIADDPGELKRFSNGCLAYLVFEDAAPSAGHASARALPAVTITPTLEQRHRFFAAAAGKTYNGTLGKRAGQEPFRLEGFPWITAPAAAEQVVNRVKDAARSAVPGAGDVVVSDSWARGPAGEIYAVEAGGERYLVYASAEAVSLRFGICRGGTVTPVEGIRRGGDSHAVVPFPLKAELRGGEQLLVYRAGAEAPVAVFAELESLLTGLSVARLWPRMPSAPGSRGAVRR